MGSEVSVVALKKRRTHPFQGKHRKETQEYLLGW